MPHPRQHVNHRELRFRARASQRVSELRNDALVCDRWNRLHPTEKPRLPYVATVLGPKGGAIVAAGLIWGIIDLASAL